MPSTLCTCFIKFCSQFILSSITEQHEISNERYVFAQIDFVYPMRILPICFAPI